MEEKKYFITADWCDKGKRGIFCDRQGNGFPKETRHSEEEMNKILGAFWLILSPKSEPYTPEELKKFTRWIPLAEYQNQYGIATEGKK
jgi:hypothetical protein